jgi:adenosine deaminase
MSNTPTLTPAQIRALPKVDLHRHLDCSMRWSTLCELAPTLGLELPTNQAARREKFLVTSPMIDLNSVLQKFGAAQKLLASAQILSRLAYEACEDAFNDGVLILELRYAPNFINDAHPHLTFDKIQEAFVEGIERAKKKWPIAVGLICIVQKTKSVAIAASVIDFAIAHKGTFVGVDLADPENNFDPRPMASLFQRAKAENLHITIHAGETPLAESPISVQESIDILGAERIGHGVQIIRDLGVLEFVRFRGIPLEVCPWSNYLTQAFPRLEDHPLRILWNSGVLVTLNSDDPGIFDSRLSDEYEIAQHYHQFGLPELTRANDVAAAVSFIPVQERQKVWPRQILSN